MIVDKQGKSWYEHSVDIPVKYMVTGSGAHIISTIGYEENVLEESAIVQGETLEEAEEKFIHVINTYLKMYRQGWVESLRWKPLRFNRKGRWFTVFGVGLHFRKHKPGRTKGGVRIPLINFNLKTINHWKIFKHKKDRT